MDMDMPQEITLQNYPIFLELRNDPIRPHLSLHSRIEDNKKSFWIPGTEAEVGAVICTAFLNNVPRCESDLTWLKEDPATAPILSLYTIWSNERGAGQRMVFEMLDYVNEHFPNIKRIVTLSPQTPMAERFHLKNGAFELQVNEDTVNYEYLL